MKILRGRADQEDKFKKQIQEYKNKGYNVSLFTTDKIEAKQLLINQGFKAKDAERITCTAYKYIGFVTTEEIEIINV